MCVLLLSISKRSGHQHAAYALENAFRIKYPSIEVINCNFFEFIGNPLTEQLVTKTYFSILRNKPELWDYIYNNENILIRTQRLRKLINKQASMKLHEILDEIQPSVVICTQAFPCEVTATLKRNSKIDIPLVAVVTDFVAHAYWVNQEVDLYTVPTMKTREILLERGIPEYKIQILGIPIKPEFEIQYDSDAISDIKNKLKLHNNLPVILLMGGSHGFGPIQEIVELLNHNKMKFQLLVVTGLNRSLRRELNQIKNNLNYPVTVYGYVDNIHELMSVSDILITKPGGMTSTEALIKKVPMLIIYPLPGQEERNSRFLINSGAAIRLDKLEDIPDMIIRLLSEPKLIGKLKENMNELVVHNSSRKTVNAISQLVTDVETEKFEFIS